ncbi:unnamed protein product [Pseudo-nitzschia multistriata]|uniref:Fe2OG dioxygenase domain-containing protein n=1 Tax=Pseudo-nitzschia multistriata TaxID=183589 RepID=A0A448ZAV9_9STRA|nr:unnamed protein product [Pseudo-nitzschia multistriata]
MTKSSVDSETVAKSATAVDSPPDHVKSTENDSGDEHARKRPKTSGSPSTTGKTRGGFDDILSPDLSERKSSILQSYQAAEPFPYFQIKDVFRPEFLTACKEEIKAQTKVNFKESDLFRVYQSIDFANLDEERAKAMQLDLSKLRTIARLRDLLYSQEWRSLVEGFAGLPPGTLIDKIDCACNCHAPGCHLLCHDDVIGTRKISYIIYMTEENWDGPTEGGALELYGPQADDNETSSSRSTPIPVARAWPVFNSMAFFEVLPGRSFHAVQEVTGDRPRLSLQGWYHSRDPPPQEELQKATLQQLKSMNKILAENDGDNNDTKPPSVPTSEEHDKDAFSEEDRNYLRSYIQNEYLTEESMNEIQIKFENNSTIQFRNFLLQKWVPRIESNYKKSDDEGDQKPVANSKSDEGLETHYGKGVTKEWRTRGPAHKQRYLAYEGTDDGGSSSTKLDSNDDASSPEAVGRLLQKVQKEVFESEQFLRYLKRVTSLDKPTGFGGSGDRIRRFRPGLDYTVAHYGLLQQESVLDATMCFVRDTTEYDTAMWESGDIGGFECYIEADIDEDEDMDMQDGGDGSSQQQPVDGESGATDAAAASKPSSKGHQAADEYNEDDDTELLSVSASNNTLSLVYRDPGTMRFVKYVSSSAPSSRYDICMEYELPPDDDDGGEDTNDADGVEESEQA